MDPTSVLCQRCANCDVPMYDNDDPYALWCLDCIMLDYDTQDEGEQTDDE
jgi:hypothetical protein